LPSELEEYEAPDEFTTAILTGWSWIAKHRHPSLGFGGVWFPPLSPTVMDRWLDLQNIARGPYRDMVGALIEEADEMWRAHANAPRS